MNWFEAPAKAIGQKIGDVAAGAGQVGDAMRTLAKGPIGVADRAKQASKLSMVRSRRRRFRVL